MNIAFYAPMKAPDDRSPSGDRTVARGLIAALRRAGHRVSVPTRLRSYDRGDPGRQARLQRLGGRIACRLSARLGGVGVGAGVGADSGGSGPTGQGGRRAERPDLWFTYHLYHKAPDWIGPEVSGALGIPYVVAEASVAGKQAGGRWAAGHRRSLVALSHADLVVGLNPADAPGVAPHLRPDALRLALPPFLDLAPFLAAGEARAAARARLAGQFGLDPERPWLVAAAMMRNDQKLASYRLLADALKQLARADLGVILVGDGPAEAAVRAAFSDCPETIAFVGGVGPEAMPALYAAADLYVWPAIKEAWSMALIEAQASGLPVVAGRSGGVPDVVAEGVGGVLVPEGDVEAFAAAIAALLDPVRRLPMGVAAREAMLARHGIDAASRDLDAALRRVVTDHRERRLAAPPAAGCP